MKETMLLVTSSVILILGDFSHALELNNCEKAIYNCCDEETHSPLSLRLVYSENIIQWPDAENIHIQKKFFDFNTSFLTHSVAEF